MKEQSPLDQAYAGLPVLMLGSFKEITPRLLQQTLRQFRSQQFDFRKFTWPYWKKRILASARGARAKPVQVPPGVEALEHPKCSKVDLLYTIVRRSAAELDDIEGPLLVWRQLSPLICPVIMGSDTPQGEVAVEPRTGARRVCDPIRRHRRIERELWRERVLSQALEGVPEREAVSVLLAHALDLLWHELLRDPARDQPFELRDARRGRWQHRHSFRGSN